MVESLGYALAALLAIAGRSHRVLHVFQLEHYEGARLRLWIARRGERFPWALCAIFGAAALIGAIGHGWAGGAVALAGGAWELWAALHREQIKPLVLTPRARRLYGASIALAGAFVIVAALGLPWASALVAVVVLVAAPEIMIVSAHGLAPYERAVNRRFVQRAKESLSEIAPLVVGITGSYGKTTTKTICAEVASLAGPAYPTPASFNSYLGVVRAINEGLRRKHRSFICEMGAYRRGDIAELCELVSPRIGILTSIGIAHLERFGSIEEIANAKGELAEAIGPEGTLITSADDPRCLEAAERCRGPVILCSALDSPEAHYATSQTTLARGRASFTVRCPDGENVPVTTRLLGTHNVTNALYGFALGEALELDRARIGEALGRVCPPDHRLAPIINKAAGIVVLDDAYNANPVGAAAALEVLRDHEAIRRVLVTPGLVEMGERQETENRWLGELAADACDVAYLIGTGGRQIMEAMIDAGFDSENLAWVARGTEAHEMVGNSSRRGDVILFENDLPDLYSDL